MATYRGTEGPFGPYGAFGSQSASLSASFHTGPLAEVTKGFEKLNTAIKEVTSTRAGSFFALQTTIKEVVAGLVAFKAVSLASPGTIQRFNYALQDTIAVFGQRLAPVLEGVIIPGLRLLGDVFNTILPDAKDFKEV